MTPTLPLTFPEQLWEQIPEEQRSVLRHADSVLHAMTPGSPASLRELHEKTGMGVEDLLHAIQALDGMDLVSVFNDGRNMVVTIVALPDDFVRIADPTGAPRWVFVTRPLVAPAVDPSQLN